jgi:hypothetical protein
MHSLVKDQYIEYNASANDLGFHVSLDAEDWETLQIVNPNGTTIFDIDISQNVGGYKGLGLTELFFEGAEPRLNQTGTVLADLLVRSPEGDYTFIGTTVKGTQLMSTATLSHAVPAGPVVSAGVDGDTVVISWVPVQGPAPILPDGSITIVGYQVIVDTFQVSLPASSTQVTLPAEFAQSLGGGNHAFEVLAIDESGNQTITESSSTRPSRAPFRRQSRRSGSRADGAVSPPDGDAPSALDTRGV